MFRNMFGDIPPVTKNLLIINVLMYILTLVMGSNGTDLGTWLAGHYINTDLFRPYQIITHMFMHDQASIMHILFNMLILVLIGGGLEKIWGAKKYFIVYFASGLGAFALYNIIGVWQFNHAETVLIQGNEYIEFGYRNLGEFKNEILTHIDNGTWIPTWPSSMMQYYEAAKSYYQSSVVGASGALFGLLAAFGLLFPNQPMHIMFIPVPIKAKYLIGGYLAYEVYNSIYQTNDHVAHIAHVGGAIVGIIIVLIWRKRGKNFM
jgi:membrane associated rhomboid family serine protease